MDWHLLGNGVASLECALILAWLCRTGARGLRKLSVPVLIVFLSLAVGTGIVAQKTNGVNNLPPMPPRECKVESVKCKMECAVMTSTTLHSQLSTLHSSDVARGWRVECVTTNETVSYTMPTNAVYVGNWHIHGARSSFGNNVVNLGDASASDWSFPLGTNGAAFSSFWYFVDGRIRPKPKDAAREICAVGVPMSAVPGKSRLWAMADDDCRVLTWENFFLGGDTNAPVNAQIRLFANGDFTTSSNDVETVCRRVNPDDWDGDGIPNPDDANPMSCDGDFFGPANILPEGANTNAYCTVSVVATGPDSLITFAGDGPSNYSDPCFIVKSGVTNEVVILIGKTYRVSSDFPLSFVGVSDPATEIVPLRGSVTRVCRPVTITCSGGNPFTMNVSPLNLGGVFSWQPLGCACTLSGIGDTFQFSCSQSCTCCGSSADGEYSYEGYSLFATTCPCGCYYDGTGASWGPSTNYSASVSAAFTKPAVIFEDPYEDKPGDWVSRRSTRTRLNVVASGGLYGATLSVSATNLARLCHLSGPALPLAPVSVPSGTSVGYSIVYDGLEASETQDDIAVTATVTENMTGMALSNECNSTSIRLELAAVWEAPENPCTNRHVYGVGEKVRIQVFPEGAATVGLTRIDEREAYYDNLMDGDAVYICPVYSATPQLKATCQEVEYSPQMTIVEPESIICRGAGWDTPCLSPGQVGGTMLSLTNYVGPMSVSFHGIMVAEIPCYDLIPPTGYFATNYHERLTHSFIYDNGASMAVRIDANNYWTVDRAGHPGTYLDWSAGRLEWKIPIGWFRRWYDDDARHGISEAEFVNQNDALSRKMLIGGRDDVYMQVFMISEDGTASVQKHGHVMSRSRMCRVRLDGRTIQWFH